MVKRSACGDMEFRFFRPGVEHIFLVGDFNGWHRSAFPMIPTGDGWWVYRLRLAPGSYQFQYLADGNWYIDFAAFGVDRGPFGWNSVVLVDPDDRLTNLTLWLPGEVPGSGGFLRKNAEDGEETTEVRHLTRVNMNEEILS